MKKEQRLAANDEQPRKFADGSERLAGALRAIEKCRWKLPGFIRKQHLPESFLGEIDDVLQEVIVQYLRYHPQVKDDIEIEKWTWTVSTNALRYLLRKDILRMRINRLLCMPDTSVPFLFDYREGANPTYRIQEQEYELLLQNEVNELPDRQREAAGKLLFYHQDREKIRSDMQITHQQLLNLLKCVRRALRISFMQKYIS